MKGAARLLMLAGAAGLALFLFRSSPRDVTLVYGLGGTGARSVEVEILRRGEVLRRAELRVDRSGQASHHVRLPDGDYALRVLIEGEGPPRAVDRTITVSESGPIVVPLGG